ncbi:hypothetical protein Acsp02_39640, partial [Actinoplanes sp. NBRC 103695]
RARRVTTHAERRVRSAVLDAPAARLSGPGLGGSDGQHHPPRHDIDLPNLISNLISILIYTQSTVGVRWKAMPASCQRGA